MLNRILSTNQWILEGVHYKWVLQSFADADLILYLDTPIWKRNYRILKRFAIQKLGFEKGNYKQTFDMLRKIYGWSYNHPKKEKPEILQIVEPYHELLGNFHNCKSAVIFIKYPTKCRNTCKSAVIFYTFEKRRFYPDK